MEITINREDLYKAISKVQSIIEKRSNMPILSMILLSATDSYILISATDLEISFQQKVPADVSVPGSITVPGRKLFEILKESKSSKIDIKERAKTISQSQIFQVNLSFMFSAQNIPFNY